MSYDIYLEINTGGTEMAEVAEVGNYTTNVARMWHHAIEGFAIGGVRLKALYDLNGLTAADSAPALRYAIANMNADPATYEAMNPANGWGDADGARKYLEKFADLCEKHPNTTVRISR